jgi:hypothetical protein
MTPAEMEKINSADLDQRKSMTMGKYVLKAFDMIAKKDQSKFIFVLTPARNIQFD